MHVYHLTKTKEEYQKTGDIRYKKRDRRHIYQNELDKACFEDDTAYGDFKYLPKRTASDKWWKEKYGG